MSAPIPNPARDVLLRALYTVGHFAESLGVSRAETLTVENTCGMWVLPTPHPLPEVVFLTDVEALGWTVLAHWIEHGGHPIERKTRLGGASAVGWHVSLAGRTWSRAVATPQDHARVAELAAALLVLRRWACPVRPWGLRDLAADSVDRAQREASVRALGPRPAVALDSPIPTSYLAAHGTAAE